MKTTPYEVFSRILAGTALFALILVSGCALPIGYSGTAGPMFARGIGQGGHNSVGAGTQLRIHPLGSEGLVVGADFETLQGIVNNSSHGRALAAAGYALVPRPFDSHWGVEVVARGGFGGVPVGTAVTTAEILSPAVSLYWRLSGSSPAWKVGMRAAPTLLLGPDVSFVFAHPTSGPDTAWKSEVAGMLALRLNVWDLGAL